MCNSQFCYEMNNECYKAYTHIKKLSLLILFMVKANIYFFSFLSRFMLNGNWMYSSMSFKFVGVSTLVVDIKWTILKIRMLRKHDVFLSTYLSQKEPKKSHESFFYLSLKNDTLDSDLKKEKQFWNFKI